MHKIPVDIMKNIMILQDRLASLVTAFIQETDG